MTPAQALATATTIPAALLGHARDLGAIAPGYFADLVAVDGDPLADIDVVINKVRWVMKGGAVVVDRTRPAGRMAAGRGVGGRRVGLSGADDDQGARRAVPAPPRRPRVRQGRRRSRAEVADRHLARNRRTAQWTNSDQTGDEWLAAMRRNHDSDDVPRAADQRHGHDRQRSSRLRARRLPGRCATARRCRTASISSRWSASRPAGSSRSSPTPRCRVQ